MRIVFTLILISTFGCSNLEPYSFYGSEELMKNLKVNVVFLKGRSNDSTSITVLQTIYHQGRSIKIDPSIRRPERFEVYFNYRDSLYYQTGRDNFELKLGLEQTAVRYHLVDEAGQLYLVGFVGLKDTVGRRITLMDRKRMVDKNGEKDMEKFSVLAIKPITIVRTWPENSPYKDYNY